MAKKTKKKKKRIRPLALCVFRRADKIFVSRVDTTPHKADQTFYRPIGGRIEFGEPGAQTVIREVKEELGATVVDVVYLGALENIFSYEGKAGHEIVLLFDGRFTDPSLNQDDVKVAGTDGAEHLYEASWKALSFFQSEGAPPLYPLGLLELLAARDENE